MVAHGTILRIADHVAINYRKADITDKQKAMLDFAMTVGFSSDEIGDEDYETLRSHDFDDEDIWDIGAIAAFFCLSNRLANLISMRLNDVFYTMGR